MNVPNAEEVAAELNEFTKVKTFDESLHRLQMLVSVVLQDREQLAKDAERWRYARKILPYEVIQDSQLDFESWGGDASEFENKRCDDAIDLAMGKTPCT